LESQFRLARCCLLGCKQRGEEGGALRHGVDEDVFVGGVGAVAYGAEAVEGGDAEGGGEVAVGAAAGCGFAKREAEFAGDGFGAGEKGGAVFVLERGAIEPAVNFEFCAAMDGLQGVQALFEGAHVGVAPGAEIERGCSAVGDDVGAGAAGDDVGVDGDAAAEVVPLFQASDLRGEFVNGVDAFFGSKAGVGSAAVDDEFRFADTLAGSLEQAAGAQRRLQHEDGVAATGLFFNQFARGFAADFFVGGPQKNQALLYRGLQFANGFEREERLNDAGFHVERAGAVDFSAGNAKRHFSERAGGIDRVIVAEDEELRFDSTCRRFPDHAEMIATVLLSDDLGDRAVAEPFFSQKFATAVGWPFVQAGRFEYRQFAQRLQHLRQPFAKVGKERKLGHGKGMVARPANPNGMSKARRGPREAK
jgi:hypothetical protein